MVPVELPALNITTANPVFSALESAAEGRGICMSQFEGVGHHILLVRLLMLLFCIPPPPETGP